MIRAALLAASTSILLAAPAQAVSVAANLPVPTDLGSFAAGRYTITATGLVDLVGPPGSGFTMRPDGVPDSPVTTPGYGYFNPNGSFTADGLYGPGGAGIRIGALMGTFNAVPTSPSDYFLIGYGTVVELAAPGRLYAQVNDTAYANNGGAFEVTVLAADVPEPGAWALMLAGFGLAGASVRRARRVGVAFA